MVTQPIQQLEVTHRRAGTLPRTVVVLLAVTAATLGLTPIEATAAATATASPMASTSAPPPTSIGATASLPSVDAPVTWSDIFQEQYWVDVTDTGGFRQLVIGRNSYDGTPDESWGILGGEVGVRTLTPTPPADDVARELVVAATDTGTLDLDGEGYLSLDPGWIAFTWVPDTCDPMTTVCDRWFTRAAADGSPIGSPVMVSGSARPIRALPDGSFLTVSLAGALGWWGPDGIDRGAPTVAAADVVDATVDSLGRLLVTTTDGHLTRRPAGGPADLTLTSTGCPAGSAVHLATDRAYGFGTDDPFATVCDATATTPLTVVNHHIDGTIDWTTTSPNLEPDAQGGQVSTAVIDHRDGGVVYVAATGTRTAGGDYPTSVFVQGFGRFGVGPLQYQRDAGPQDPLVPADRVTDLRVTRDGVGGEDARSLVMVDDVHGGTTVTNHHEMANVAVLPLRSSDAPLCAVPGAHATPTGPRTAAIGFAACGPQPIPYRQVRRYCVASEQMYQCTDGDGADPGYVLPARLADRDAVTPVTISAQNVIKNGYVSDPEHDLVLDTVGPFWSVDAFLARQAADLLGSAAGTRNVASSAAGNGGIVPSRVMASMLDAGLAHRDVEPVARLYRAFFLRTPDLGGLRHWVGRHRGGVSLSAIADAFARSNEFMRRYGPLTNRQFVAKLYPNVFGRAADSGGLAYWAKRLDSHRSSRGQVVLQFSESSEGVRRSAKVVLPLAVTYLMLDRLPTPSEAGTFAGFTDLHRQTAAALLVSDAYAIEVNGP